VLIVEDEPSVADVLVGYLRELGRESSAARTAEEALRTLDREHVDAIVLDLRLPGMHGLDFLRLPRVRELGIPVIAMSGVATEGEAREALELGALDFLQKPIGLDRLAATLRAFSSAAAIGGRPAERGRDSQRQ
jgi:DNA-binding response OmpR family regulator